MPTTMIRSARLPASSDPISRSSPSARAPPIVAISSAVAAGTAARIARLQLVQGTRPGASPRTCRGRCCWRRRRCRGRAPRRPPGTSSPAPCRSPASCCFPGCARRRRPRRFRMAMSSSASQTRVRGERARRPEANRLEVAGRRRAGLLLRISHLVLGLREVDDQRHAVLARRDRGTPAASPCRACTPRAAPRPA